MSIFIRYGTNTTMYRKYGKLHRDNGPAVVINTKDYIIKKWYQHGSLCREEKYDREDGFIFDCDKDWNYKK